MKILVSGFEAFGGETVNPTALLIDDLAQGRLKTPENTVSVLLPVSFANAFAKLEDAIDRERPDIVVALGQAGGREAIEIERVALNVMDATIADNDGRQPRDEAIHPNGEAAYFSTLPIRALEAALTAAAIPVRVSNTAGLYVCNHLFYRLQAQAGLKKLRSSGFIHLPYLPDQASGKNVPSMEFETMKRALEILLATLV